MAKIKRVGRTVTVHPDGERPVTAEEGSTVDLPAAVVAQLADSDGWEPVATKTTTSKKGTK